MMFTEAFWQPVLLSLKVAGSSLIIVTVFGILTAWLMSRKSFRAKTLVETLFLLPIVLPPTVVGFILIILFGNNGVIGKTIESIFKYSVMFTPLAALLASIVVAFPLMYESVKTGMDHVDRDLEDAARVDGAGEWRVFIHITLPLCYQSILTGMVLSFARSLGEFGATLMFAGNIPGKTQTLPTAIYIAIESGNMQLAWTFVGVVIMISFIMLYFVRKAK
jgi:molybdate transport system permease protein